MSHLNYLEKLLEGVGTEWQALGDLVTLRRGRVMSKGFLSENTGIFPVYSSQTANDGMIGSIDTYDFDGEYISWTTDGANAGTIFYRKGKFSITNVCGVMKIIDENLLNYKYLYYWLTTEAKKYVSSGMGNPKLMSHQVEKIVVPIPCPDNPEKSLAIQAEIVRILDAFTAMTAELTAELTMRKKQYNYYRDKLLTSELPSSKTATLGEVLDMRAGRHIKAKDISAIKNTEHKYICFGGNGSRGFVQAYSHDGDYALIGRQGALCGNVKRATGKFYATEHAVVCTPKEEEEIDIDWIFHMLTFMNLNQYKSQSAQPGLAVGNLANLAINFPPISEQKKIAKILNKFDTLTTSLQEGLPREIELRQKQYEYYHDLLLSFPKSNEEEA